ncbi:hypothetical protein AGMMS50212_13830 [Spirochaetia bacterium]|nr:hypothetical protein AGMMS50212_13830 [Spirochaetia bacterium]
MQAIKAYYEGRASTSVIALYDGQVFIPEVPVSLEKNRRVTLSYYDECEKIVTPCRLTAAQKAEQDKRDLELINRNADKLNEEALDVLQYQVDFF